MSQRRQLSATLLSIAVVATMVGSVVLFGAAVAPAAASDHTKDEAEDLTEQADFEVVLPYSTDHYPGDQNEANGSIEYYASGADAFGEVGAGDGLYIDYVIIDAPWIDYSECSTPNTKSFGIDRGNNNSGTQTDEDLVQRQKNVDFRDDGITIEIYDFSDFAGDPPYMAPEDAIVAAQGAGSQDGTCLTMTSEPGWYRVQGFINGTVADNGPDEEPSDSAEEVGFKLNSNYLYVCECDNEQQAREQLGPPPNEDDGGSQSTPEPTATPEPTPTPDDTSEATATPEPTATPESTPEPTEQNDDTPQPTEPPEDTAAPTATQSNNGGGGGGGGGSTGMTPTAGSGAGFGSALAALALLGSALLVRRRG